MYATELELSIIDLSKITSDQFLTSGISNSVNNEKLLIISVVPPPTAVDWTSRIPCVLEVPQGAIAYPDVHALATQVSKITGLVMPTATDSTINFKVIVPENLNSTINALIRVYTLTLSANTSDAINLTLDMRYTGDTENLDQVNDINTAAANFGLADTIESLDIHDITPESEPTAKDMITGQLFRDVTADEAGDVMIVGIDLIIDRTSD